MANYPTVFELKQGQFGVRFGESLTIVGNSLVKYEKDGTDNVKVSIEFSFTPDAKNWDVPTMAISEKLGGIAIGSVEGSDSKTIRNPSVQFLVDPDDITLHITSEPPPPSKGTHSN